MGKFHSSAKSSTPQKTVVPDAINHAAGNVPRVSLENCRRGHRLRLGRERKFVEICFEAATKTR